MSDKSQSPGLVTPGQQLQRHAMTKPDAAAVLLLQGDGSVVELSWSELDASSTRLAHQLARSGVDGSSLVAIALPNSLEHVIATQAVWKLGACPMPLNPSLPRRERDALLALGNPTTVISGWDDVGGFGVEDVHIVDRAAVDVPVDAIPQPFKAIASGGSTGEPKLIVTPGAFAYPEAKAPLLEIVDLRGDDLIFSPGPLYHNQAFLLSGLAIYAGATVLLNVRFQADLALRAIERQGVTYLNAVPTMLSRMLRAPQIEACDLSTVRVVLHLAAPCPDWVKRGWIDLVGPEAVWEMWAATEMTGITMIRGSEWLEHPGSVGRPIATEIRIVDERGNDLPSGEVGEIYSRMPGVSKPQHTYLGSKPLPTLEGGWASVGDLGSLDENGYLYLADRRSDLIISGGANVYPAEVEATLSEHAMVADVAVIGLPDDDLGQRVHAIVQPEPGRSPDEHDLAAFCQQQIVRYKVPRTFEFVAELPRSAAGKLRRSDLIEERSQADPLSLGGEVPPARGSGNWRPAAPAKRATSSTRDQGRGG